MEPMRFPEEQRSRLLGQARESILHGLAHGCPPRVDVGSYPEPLARPGASFVTLKRDGCLRGCIGSLEPRRPLVNDVSENAFAAAFRDPRFPPLAVTEFGDLGIQISVLGEPEPLDFADEEGLLAQLECGRHGLIIEEGGRRATFLPSVWESLPDPQRFLSQLKRKAGLPEGYWSDTLRASRYLVESFGIA